MTRRPSARRLDLRALRILLAVLFAGLALPAGVLVRQAFDQLELDTLARERLIAEEVARRIDAGLARAVAGENARPFSDYAFAAVTPGGGEGLLQRSPLSALDASGQVPGAIGYFQVDAGGRFSTPLLPAGGETGPGIGPSELAARREAAARLLSILGDNGLVIEEAANERDAGTLAAEDQARGGASEAARREALRPSQLRAATQSLETEPPAAPPAVAGETRGQARFDQLAAGASAAPEEIVVTAARADAPAETEAGVASDAAAEESATAVDAVRISAFDGELEPLRFHRLDTGHFVLFRNAWQEGLRFVQGMLIDEGAFFSATHADLFSGSTLAAGSRLEISMGGNVVERFAVGSPVPDTAELLYATRLSPPLAGLQLRFFAGELPRSPAFGVLVWTTVVLAAVLIGGFLAIYRFGAQQIRLARQQRDFVSAVSHELKTPLTSIRMYGEMLKSGWASEEKKRTYYDYIFEEGERLSRLIDNVLQLARINEGGPAVEPRPMTLTEIVDLARSKTSTQAERGGFELRIEVETGSERDAIEADPDALSQVFINLVDNAIKYVGDAARREIRLTARRLDADTAVLCVRDYGPGVPPADMKRLFELFYRPDNALTRSTAGTGIGLSLVHQLVTAMGGRVDVRNCGPGAEFRLIFPLL